MSWIIFGSVMSVLFVSLIVYLYIRDKGYEKKTIYETMGDDIRKEIDLELADALERRLKFKDQVNSVDENSITLDKVSDNRGRDA